MERIAIRLMTSSGELDRRIIRVSDASHGNEKASEAIKEAIEASGWTLSVGDSIAIEEG